MSRQVAYTTCFWCLMLSHALLLFHHIVPYFHLVYYFKRVIVLMSFFCMQRPVKCQLLLSQRSESKWQPFASTFCTLIVNTAPQCHPRDNLSFQRHLNFFLFTHWVYLAFLLPKPFIFQRFNRVGLYMQYSVQLTLFHNFLFFSFLYLSWHIGQNAYTPLLYVPPWFPLVVILYDCLFSVLY